MDQDLPLDGGEVSGHLWRRLEVLGCGLSENQIFKDELTNQPAIGIEVRGSEFGALLGAES